MTQPVQTPVQRFTGDGAQTAFPVTAFGAASAAEVEVSLNGVLQVLGVSYTLSGLTLSGVTINFTVAPGAGVTVAAQRSTTQTQETDYLENDPFPAETHERALDKLTRLAQDLYQRLTAIPRFRVDKTPASLDYPGPNQFLRMNATGDGIVGTTGVSSGTPFSPNSAVQALQDSAALPAESIALFHDDGNPATHENYRALAKAVGQIIPVADNVGGLIRILSTSTVELFRRRAISVAVSTLLDATHNEATVGVDATGGARTISLPSVAGLLKSYSVTITKTDASANFVIIDTNDAATIEGAASINLIDQHSGITFILNEAGTDWLTVRYINTPAGSPASPTGFSSFTASGTWTKNPSTRRVLVFALGGGGGGGGSAACIDNEVAAAGGGASGAFAISFLDVSAISTATISVGAAGAAGAAGNNAGGTGGNTTWSDGTNTIAGAGGLGGSGGSVTTVPLTIGGAGGAASLSTGALINGRGSPGSHGIRQGTVDEFAISGSGASSLLGGGGRAVGVFGTASTAGNAALGFGAGGGGAAGGRSFAGTTAAQPGGLGSPGILFVLEFI